MQIAPHGHDPEQESESSPQCAHGRPVMPRVMAWLLAAQLVTAWGSGCAARPARPGGETVASAQPGPAGSRAADAQEGVAIPFALCRSFGVGGTPCYPTNVDLGNRPISPCRERLRGHCELSGPRHTMACLLSPVADGKPCGEGAVCKEGSCIKE